MPQRVPAETQFLAAPEQLAALFDAIEQRLLVVSREGTILYPSSGFAAWLGVSAEDLSGHAVSRLFHEEDGVVIERLLRESSYGPKVRGRCRLRTKNGEFAWFDAVARDRAQ